MTFNNSLTENEYKILRDIIVIIAKNSEGSKTIFASLEAAGYTGVCTFVGSFVLGPLGIVIGTTVGAVGAFVNQKTPYKSLYKVYMEDLSPEEKRQLANNVYTLIKIRFTIYADGICVELLKKAVGDSAFRQLVLDCIRSFINQSDYLEIKI